ncbi:MAG: tetratricopeptide repeat protein, partial [Candidatus Hydromicrobium sp.]
MNSKIIKIFIFLISVVLVFSIIFTTPACSKLDIEIFGKKFGGETKAEDSETEDTGTVNEQSISDIEDDSEDLGNVSDQEIIGSDSQKIKTSSNTSTETADIAELRLYFIQAMEYFKDGSYIIAEYYLNKVKDSYLILQDHIFYYMAKSLFYQEKYDQAEEYYLKLIKNYPDSIWAETASLEYADMFYVREDYITAEDKYEYFITTFPHSSYVPYCLFQLAICQEMNGKKDLAFGNYKEIWLNYPLNEHSETVWENLIRLPAEDSSIEPFVPTANQIYHRGEIFFGIYHYNSALDEFNRILQGDYLNSLSQELYSKTLFKKGMCYFNLRDYSQSKYYLSLSYEKSPSGSVADYSLYYLGRSLTNLNLDADAISYYQKLVELFPNSNYCDDALYRIGRIYFFKEDFQNAASYFQKVSSNYPLGDKLPDALWELGWIQYRSADYNSAKTTFSNYASSYKGRQLEEKGLFWQAKCCQKLGNNDSAIVLYQKIIDLNSYS